MGVITKIEEQKNKNRVNIFVDDSFFCGLEKETAVIFGLKLNKEVDEKELEQAVIKSEEKRSFEKAISLIEKKMNTKKELKDKLLKRGFSEDCIKSTINKLEEYHYIDDDLYAKLFIEQNPNLSKKMISNKLMQKGINKEIIEKNLLCIDNETEYENCMALAKKFLKTSKIENFNDKQKFMAKLVRRGFSFDIIKKVMSNLNYEIDEFD